MIVGGRLKPALEHTALVLTSREQCADQCVRCADMKARQSSKIRELGDALTALGFLTLDQQAMALGLARSTTWTLLNANHKGSGLSATVINRMLTAPQLPPLVRATILKYIDEKAAGLYGHSKLQLRRFSARLSEQSRIGHFRPKLAAEH
jgi:adenine-specific DNA methylase